MLEIGCWGKGGEGGSREVRQEAATLIQAGGVGGWEQDVAVRVGDVGTLPCSALRICCWTECVARII